MQLEPSPYEENPMRTSTPTSRSRRGHAVGFALAALSLLAGCGGDSSTNPTAGIAGSYSLISVDGTPLPFLIVDQGTFRVEILDEKLVVTSDAKYATLAHLRITENGQETTITEQDAGTYTVSGSTVTFVSADPQIGTNVATIDGGTLTVKGGMFVLVYQR
jgi:hypothetical protein